MSRLATKKAEKYRRKSQFELVFILVPGNVELQSFEEVAYKERNHHSFGYLREKTV